MKHIFIILIFLFCLDSICQDFKLEMNFEPSFISESILIFQKDSNHCFISLNAKNISEIQNLSSSEIDSLKNFFKTYSFSIKRNGSSTSYRQYVDTKLLPDTNWVVVEGDTVRKELRIRLGYIFDPDSNKYYFEYVSTTSWNDGIMVRGKLSIEDSVKKIVYFSPSIGDEHYNLTKLLFKLMNSNFKNETTITYVEQLEGYFGFGLGIKKLSERPLSYKLYGFISLAEENDLIRFFSSLPVNKKVYIDMSNFIGMGTRFHIYFTELVLTHNKIYWVNCPDSVKKLLKSIGVQESNFKNK